MLITRLVVLKICKTVLNIIITSKVSKDKFLNQCKVDILNIYSVMNFEFQVSSDGRLIAVSLLDSTVKVFFVDTLKFFLSLYGHKLPATAIDISSDSTLIVTGSADKNVKIWGLDFGDCHKSIFAHDDTVTALQFVPNTHMFFTAGKDGKIKQWDADNFERILTLEGHMNEVKHF